MSKPVRRALSRGGRTYVWSVAAAGCAVATYCVATLARDGVSVQLLLFGALTILSGRVTLKVPSVTARFSPSEMFTFSCVLLFGPAAGALALATDSLVLAWRQKWRLEQTLFNFGSLALSVWIAGTLFFLTAGVAPLASALPPSSDLLLPLGVLAASYFLINSGLIATAIAFDIGRRPLSVWREHFLWLGPGYAAGACVAFLLVVALRQVQFGALTAFLLIAPVLLVFYFTLQSSFGRAEDAKGHVAALNRLYLSTVETLATAIDAKDEVTHGHIRRVQVAAMALAREIGINDASLLQAIEAAALLHDTGKIAVPEHILNKPGKLTAAEFEKMKLHAPIGAEILAAIDFPYPVVPIVRHHHENWDGTGYPDGLAGAAIPIGARILSVVDCYDALTSDRPYRRRLTDEASVAILTERRGTMYDSMVVDAFIKARHQIMPACEPAGHPVLRTLGEARESIAHVDSAPVPAADTAATAEVLAVASLARAVSGEAGIADVGALTWMMLRQVVPAVAMSLFTYDDKRDTVVAQYAGGVHAGALRGMQMAVGAGVAGWAAANRRFVLNADAAIDLGPLLAAASPPLRASLTMPLVHEGAIVGVVSLYASAVGAFSDDHARLLSLLAPSLATSLAALPKTGAWTGAQPGRLRPAAGELRLLKR
ncbi:MAG: HD domain-containing protein [Acidobacteriota bacterium]|nr:HD domain-containing protein [Acidobacteriota bacterium]